MKGPKLKVSNARLTVNTKGLQKDAPKGTMRSESHVYRA